MALKYLLKYKLSIHYTYLNYLNLFFIMITDATLKLTVDKTFRPIRTLFVRNNNKRFVITLIMIWVAIISATITK